MNDSLSLLVVEDDQGVRESLSMVLEYQGYQVATAASGEEGLELAAARPPTIVLLDVNLPGIDGVETCRRLRANGFGGQVLMLTARSSVADRVAGLDAGADDYLPKPFSLDELLARVRVMARRETANPGSGTEPAEQVLYLDTLSVDVAARVATRAGHRLDLTKIEFDLLSLLLLNTNIVLSRQVILERVWGYDDELGSNSLEVFVSALRKKMEVDGASRLIHTVRGVGYVARVAE